MPYATLYAPNTFAAPAAPTNAAGSQTNPLNIFHGVAGTGNKTTNKDLPEWLRKLGMKGDAYAGGMLKPQIRYGFWFKDGKINFADGTSFAAKKQKGGTYSYTGADGKAAVYDPTDEQDAYNKKYKAKTSNQSFLDKAKNTINYENAGVKRLWEGVKDNPLTLLTDPARTPAGTWFHNQLTGDDLKPLTGQLGGHSRDDWYEGEKGYAGELNQAAEVVAAFYGGQALSGIGAAGGSGGASGGATGGDLGIFSNGGAGGMAGVGGGNAGALAASGAITGGAGIGGTTAGALGNASGAANSVSGVGGGGMAEGNSNLWSDLAQLGASLYSSYNQGQGAKDASRASAAGYEAGIAEQRRQFDIIQQMLLPQRQLGVNAINSLAAINGYRNDGTQGPSDMSGFYTSPDYNFRRDEGTRDIGNSFAARGGALSGNALRGITDFNSNLASGEFNNFYQRRLQEAGLGGAATSQTANAAQYTGANVSNLLGQQGNARASGVVDQTNAMTNGINDIANWYGNWQRNRQNQYGGG